MCYIDRHVDLEGRIRFKSERPVSFCLTINFSDDRALAICSLKVYAIADNSLLTTYMYSMRSYIMIHDDDVSAKYTERSHLSVSSDSGVEEDDEGIAHRHVCSPISLSFHFSRAIFQSRN